MAGTSALGGFVEGLQGGMKFREDSRRNKLVDKALSRQVAALDRAEIADMEMLKAEGIDATDYTAGGAHFGMDPYGEKLGLWGTMKQNFKESPIGQMIQRSKAKQTANQGQEIEEGVPQAIPGMGEDKPAQRFGTPRGAMADGGEVEKRRWVDPDTGVEFVGGVPQSEVPTSGGGVRSALGDVGRNVLGNTRRRMREWAPDAVESDREVLRAIGRGDSAADVGRTVRREMAEGAAGVGNLAMGILEDTGAAGLAKGIGGVFGIGTTPEEEAVRNSDVGAQPDPKYPNGEYPVPDDFDPNMKLYPDGAPQTVGGGAAPAAGPEVQTRKAVAPKSNPVTWADVEAAPEDVPRMNTKDWESYRKSAVKAAIYRGGTAKDGHDMVTAMQMEGFEANATQAFQLLQAGDWKRASLALTAAYQYFPNGADIKFGMAKDKQGQPALVAMGTDEKTGEPTGDPMLINQERLAMMVEHMSDPSVFRQWTKDWRNEEFERQIFEEYTKPIGEANAETARINARANEARAAASQRAAISGGGLKPSDIRSASSDFRERLGMLSLDPETESQADYLAGIMSQVYVLSDGRIDPNSTIALVMAAKDGDEQSLAILQSLGVTFGE